jgi:hypothetical protein
MIILLYLCFRSNTCESDDNWTTVWTLIGEEETTKVGELNQLITYDHYHQYSANLSIYNHLPNHSHINSTIHININAYNGI